MTVVETPFAESAASRAARTAPTGIAALNSPSPPEMRREPAGRYRTCPCRPHSGDHSIAERSRAPSTTRKICTPCSVVR